MKITSVLLAYFVASVTTCAQVAYAQDQVFDRSVSCAAPSDHFDMWQSPTLAGDLFRAGATVSGMMRVTTFEPVQKFQASVGIGFRQQEVEGDYIKLSFEPCLNGKQVCSRIYRVDSKLPKKQAFTDIPSPMGVFQLGEPIPISVSVDSSREWVIFYGANSVRVSSQFDATVISFSCVGAAGAANFEPSGPKIS